MSDELLYTSAPRGLRPGRQGFCTVAATRGLTDGWIDALEGLTGYRPAFGPTDARNPVNFAHLRIAVGGRDRSVLARIAAAGLDYSGRSNKIAHFLLPDDGARPAAGPTRMLACADLRGAWDGRVEWLSPRPTPRPADKPPRPCTLWGQFSGDAGWAGVLAESALAGRPATVVVPLGMDVLALFDEALRLLPPAHRWRVTLATYYTGLPPGVTCNWRGVLAGSPEAATAMGDVIDLTAPRTAPAGSATDAGRKGRLILGETFVPHRSSNACAVVSDEPEVRLESHGPFAFSAPPPRQRQRRTLWVMLSCLGLAIGLMGTATVALTVWYLRTQQLLAEKARAEEQQRLIDKYIDEVMITKGEIKIRCDEVAKAKQAKADDAEAKRKAKEREGQENAKRQADETKKAIEAKEAEKVRKAEAEAKARAKRDDEAALKAKAEKDEEQRRHSEGVYAKSITLLTERPGRVEWVLKWGKDPGAKTDAQIRHLKVQPKPRGVAEPAKPVVLGPGQAKVSKPLKWNDWSIYLDSHTKIVFQHDRSNEVMSFEILELEMYIHKSERPSFIFPNSGTNRP